jgi:formamidopyrimidine-DNA glycosylase
LPELPEVETVVRTLAPHLRGRQIVSASFSSPFVTPGNRRALARRLTGRTIQSIARRGKFIVIQLDHGTLTVHLGMTGRLLVDAPATKHTYGIFTLDTGCLIYTDPRQFGRILWNHDLSRLGPEPLDISLEEFRARVKSRKTGIKALLLNQTFLAGMGNIYVDETLFAARVHPLAQASRLSAPRVAAIHRHMREILAAAIGRGGSSISDYVDARGERGWFQLQHQAYGREGEPCPVCGTPIRKTTVVQRGTHYCPRCQRR